MIRRNTVAAGMIEGVVMAIAHRSGPVAFRMIAGNVHRFAIHDHERVFVTRDHPSGLHQPRFARYPYPLPKE
jgi:hypothetical protein